MGNRSVPSSVIVGEPANADLAASSAVSSRRVLTGMSGRPRDSSASRVLASAVSQLGHSSTCRISTLTIHSLCMPPARCGCIRCERSFLCRETEFQWKPHLPRLDQAGGRRMSNPVREPIEVPGCHRLHGLEVIGAAATRGWRGASSAPPQRYWLWPDQTRCYGPAGELARAESVEAGPHDFTPTMSRYFSGGVNRCAPVALTEFEERKLQTATGAIPVTVQRRAGANSHFTHDARIKSLSSRRCVAPRCHR